MDLFGRIKNFDNSLQRGLDNGFARVFGGKVVPTEIDELLKQQAEETLMSDQHGNLLAPNVFDVEVADKDLKSMLEERPQLAEDLASRLSRYIRNQGWSTSGPVTVNIAAKEQLHTGQITLQSRFETASAAAGSASPAGNAGQAQLHREGAGHEAQGQQAADQAPATPGVKETAGTASSLGWGDVVNPERAEPTNHSQPVSSPPTSYPGTEVIAQVEGDPATGGFGYRSNGQETRVDLVLRDGSDRTYTLRTGANIIGRGNGVDLRIPDTGVSRQHAEIQWDGFDAVLTDLNSTNGTQVNNAPVENWLLAHGDVISLGHSEIEVLFR